MPADHRRVLTAQAEMLFEQARDSAMAAGDRESVERAAGACFDVLGGSDQDSSGGGGQPSDSPRATLSHR